jgi:hypothetical protein
MRQKSTVIVINETEIEITQDIIDHYKRETHRKRVTKKGIEKFFNSLFEKINLHLIF